MATIGEKELKTKWPVVEGTTFATTKTHKKKIHLVPQKKSLLRRSSTIGL